MAKLVSVYRTDDKPTLLKRQAPLMIEENLMMVMDLKDLELVHEYRRLEEKELDEFMEKYMYLTEDEAVEAFRVDEKYVMNIVNESIPCIGCRRSVERFYYQLMDVGTLALDPILVDTDGKLILRETILRQHPAMVCMILGDHSERLSRLVDNQPRNKKSKRCQLHSWDVQKARLVTPGWKDVWAAMSDKCKAEITLIDFTVLLNKLEHYLKKHRFCQDCRTKVMKAYNLLVEDLDPTKEKGFNASLYLGIRRCLPGKHIHLPPNTAYIDGLICRAEPELLGTRRDRHAKSMEIAQEEVLTCIGMAIYDRIHRVFLRLREEEFTCQVLAAAGIEALVRSFETFVEKKRGVSNLELLCQELTKEEMAKRQRQELKKLKKKRKKGKKPDGRDGCECELDDVVDAAEEDAEEDTCECPKVKPPVKGDTQKLQILDRKSKGQVKCECEECMEKQAAGANISCSCHDHKEHTPEKNDWDYEERKLREVWAAECNYHNKYDESIASIGSTGHDCGYGSEAIPSSGANSSPDGSEDACSEGFCDHDGDCGVEARVASKLSRLPGPSLEEMLLSSEFEEPDDADCSIPEEEIQAFHARSRQVDAKRLELREVLKSRFAQLCIKSKTGPT